MVRIIPRDTSFFDMFAAMSNNLIDGAKALVELFTDYRDVDAKIDEIRRIEHLGDEMTHSIMPNSTRRSSRPSTAKTSTRWPPRSMTCSTSSTPPAPGS